MGSGSPDFTKRTRIMANFGGVDVIVAVDADGQLFALLKGWNGAAYVPISVDADGRMVAVMTGSDGVAARVLLTDVEGRLISVIQDPVSGFNIAIDVNGFMTTVMKGDDGGVLRTISVDASGRMTGTLVDGTTGDPLSIDSDGFLTTVLKGLDGATLRTVAVDGSGRLEATILDPVTGNWVTVDASGFLTTVMKGLDGVTLRTIAVDTDGNIVGVMKGADGATLRTISVDYGGRMEAIMVDRLNIRGVRPVVGAGELAVRLGSPVIYERTGTVIYMNTASLGEAKGKMTAAGVGATAVVSASRSISSGYSFALSCGTGGGSLAQLYDIVDMVTFSGLVGYEISVSPAGGGAIFTFGLIVYDGTTFTRYYIKWDWDDHKLYYYNSTPGWTDLVHDLVPITAIPAFHHFKLVVDLDNKKYVRLYVGAEEISLADISAYAPLDATYPHLYGHATCQEDGEGDIETAYIGFVIITVQELP